MNEMNRHPLKSNRRTFLCASAIAAGSLALGRGLPAYAAKVISDKKETLPWQPMPYVTLDTQMARERAYNAYYHWNS